MHQLDKLVKDVYVSMDSLENLIKKHNLTKQLDSGESIEKIYSYNRNIFKIMSMLWIYTDLKHPSVNMTISDISKYSGVSKSNVRMVLDKMVQMTLISYIDTPMGLKITLLHMNNAEKSYIKLPIVFLKGDFFKLPLITQRICLYITYNGYAISKDNGKNFPKRDMVKYFGDTNEWRLDKYFKEAQKFLDVNIEQKTIMELKDDIYIYKNVYNVKIGNFKAGSNQLQECKQSRISERLLITYIKDVLMKKCEYSFNKDEYSEWLTFMKIYGQQILIYTVELVGKDKHINTTMPKYFGGIAKKLKADTQVAS